MDLSINEGTLVVTGGPGTSLQDAIVIRKTPKGLSAAGAEMMLLTQRYVKRNTVWSVRNSTWMDEAASTPPRSHIK